MALTTDEISTARQVAYGSKRRYGHHVDVDDVQQELSLWMLERLDQVREWREQGDGGRAQLWRSLVHVAWKYSEAEKAARVGYVPGDNYSYDRVTVRALLPVALDEEWERLVELPMPLSASAIAEPATLDEDGEQEESVDVTAVADIRRGLQLIDNASAALLVWAVESDYDYDWLSTRAGVTYKTAHKRVERAIDKLVEAINVPKERDPYEDIPRYSDADVLRTQGETR